MEHKSNTGNAKPFTGAHPYETNKVYNKDGETWRFCTWDGKQVLVRYQEEGQSINIVEIISNKSRIAAKRSEFTEGMISERNPLKFTVTIDETRKTLKGNYYCRIGKKMFVVNEKREVIKTLVGEMGADEWRNKAMLCEEVPLPHPMTLRTVYPAL